MTTQNRHGLSPASIETIAGLSAGLFSTIIVHPLDIIKTRLQGRTNNLDWDDIGLTIRSRYHVTSSAKLISNCTS